ncbi:MAG: NUDIX domain-containing protein [Candidatus Staskawiczbacteria bacterium]|jgi:phosphatase NudJ
MTERVFTQTFGVVGAIIEKDGKFLLVKEGDHNKAAYGKWNQPAGWIDLEEDIISAVKREVSEETGYDFVPKNILGIYILVKKEGENIHHAVKIIFIGDISENKVRKLEDDISEARWFTPEEIENMGLDILRDLDIKTEIADYLSGKKYSLELLTHTIQK